MNARKKRQIDAELALMGMQATDGPGQYVTVQIEGPDGPEVYKAWACAVEAPRTRRHNPPLSEHMVHESLDDIAQWLAYRFAHSENPTLYFCIFVREISHKTVEALQLRRPGSDSSPEDRSFERMTDAMLSALYSARR